MSTEFSSDKTYTKCYQLFNARAAYYKQFFLVYCFVSPDLSYPMEISDQIVKFLTIACCVFKKTNFVAFKDDNLCFYLICLHAVSEA